MKPFQAPGAGSARSAERTGRSGRLTCDRSPPELTGGPKRRRIVRRALQRAHAPHVIGPQIVGSSIGCFRPLQSMIAGASVETRIWSPGAWITEIMVGSWVSAQSWVKYG
ncbi:hypothetical protein NDU88_002647 [Pleurodeles waltl]|uniref:Uncharacterized protein n=1 Tax=Pleurodeles waltl TaxID=8319 RepID=A0AAV7UYC0_PLEWA|nr:hypothetical protein NDU88_002647 [Pleurodeles waltl]